MSDGIQLREADRRLDRRAFRRLYRDHYAFVWHTVLRFGVPSPVAEDAVQDAFIAAYRRRSDFDGRNPRAWLYSIGRRTAANYRRGIRRRYRGHDAAAAVRPAGPRPVDEVASALRVLDRFLEGLGAADRELFVLSEVEGLTGPELSAALGRNLATLYSRVRTLRARFTDQVQDAGDAIDRARNERPRATASAWAALLPHLKSPVALAAKSSALGWLTTQLGGLTAGLALGGVVLGAVGAGARADEPPAVAQVRVPHVADLPARPDPAPEFALQPSEPPQPRPAATPLPPPVERPDPVRRSGKRRARPVAKPAPQSELAADTALLQRAAAAMRSGEPQSALKILRTHAAKHAQSPMSDLRGALLVEALCGVGRVDHARREAGRVLAKHASTPVAERIQRSCAGPT